VVNAVGVCAKLGDDIDGVANFDWLSTASFARAIADPCLAVWREEHVTQTSASRMRQPPNRPVYSVFHSGESNHGPGSCEAMTGGRTYSIGPKVAYLGCIAPNRDALGRGTARADRHRCAVGRAAHLHTCQRLWFQW
jgi:hypothetical protein